MEITYQLTPADFKALRQMHPASRVQASMRLILLVVVGAVFIWSLFAGNGTTHSNSQTTANWTSTVLSFVLPLAVIGFFWVFFYNSARRQRANDPQMLHPQTLRISPENLTNHEWSAETTLAWVRVENIKSDQNLLCFSLGSAGMLMVPQRAFADPQAAQQFEETARAYWKGLPAPSPVLPNGQWPPPPQTLEPH